MKLFPILLLSLLVTGCAAKKIDKKMSDYSVTTASCSSHDDEIDCDWNDVPES